LFFIDTPLRIGGLGNFHSEEISDSRFYGSGTKDELPPGIVAAAFAVFWL
jgi:hypothetical protein